VTGKLIAVTSDSAVIVDAQGEVTTVLKADATALKVADGKPVGPKPPPTPKSDGKPATPPPDPGEEMPKFGFFTAHGLGYGHFRTRDYSSGSAAYALDLAAGYNFTNKFGLYGLVGGMVAGKIQDRTIRANAGHANLAFRFRRKHFAFLGGVGVGWAGLREPTRRIRAVGVSIPIRLMGIIPLPKKLYIALSAGYQLGIMGKGNIFNGLSLQLAFGRG
jgi:hypothetical protein